MLFFLFIKKSFPLKLGIKVKIIAKSDIFQNAVWDAMANISQIKWRKHSTQEYIQSFKKY